MKKVFFNTFKYSFLFSTGLVIGFITLIAAFTSIFVLMNYGIHNQIIMQIVFVLILVLPMVSVASLKNLKFVNEK